MSMWSLNFKYVALGFVTQEMLTHMQNADIISHLTKEFNEVSTVESVNGGCEWGEIWREAEISVRVCFFAKFSAGCIFRGVMMVIRGAVSSPAGLRELPCGGEWIWGSAVPGGAAWVCVTPSAALPEQPAVWRISVFITGPVPHRSGRFTSASFQTHQHAHWWGLKLDLCSKI